MSVKEALDSLRKERDTISAQIYKESDILTEMKEKTEEQKKIVCDLDNKRISLDKALENLRNYLK